MATSPMVGPPDGDPVRSEHAAERVEPFPGSFACDRYAPPAGAPRLPARGAGSDAEAHGPRRTRRAVFRLGPCHPQPRDATTPSTSSAGHRSLTRPARSPLPAHGSEQQAQRRCETPARLHPSRPAPRDMPDQMAPIHATPKLERWRIGWLPPGPASAKLPVACARDWPGRAARVPVLRALALRGAQVTGRFRWETRRAPTLRTTRSLPIGW